MSCSKFSGQMDRTFEISINKAYYIHYLSFLFVRFVSAVICLFLMAQRILVLTLCDSHSNLTREAKTGTRLTVPSTRQKSEPNGSRERLLVDSCSMLSQRLPSWAASPPVGRCSLGDSFTHYSRQHAPEALATIACSRSQRIKLSEKTPTRSTAPRRSADM